MSEPKWTAGPWHAAVSMRDADIVGPKGEDIGYVNSSDGADEPTSYPHEANARLIAAAPELYDALQEAIDLIKGMLIGARLLRGETGTLPVAPTEQTTRFRALLARARGEMPAADGAVQCDCCDLLVPTDQIRTVIAYGIETSACAVCRGDDECPDDDTVVMPQPLFLTVWEREDYERRKRGEPELGPFGAGVPKP